MGDVKTVRGARAKTKSQSVKVAGNNAAANGAAADGASTNGAAKMATAKPAKDTKDAKATKPIRHLFGTDGIRGTANEWPMTPELALGLGKAVAFVAARSAPKAHVPRIL